MTIDDSSVETIADPDVFKALSHPNRVKLFSILCSCDCAQTVGELHACCDIDLSVVSRHLGVLKDANLVELTRDGQKRRYQPKRREVVAALRALADVIEASEPQGDCDD